MNLKRIDIFWSEAYKIKYSREDESYHLEENAPDDLTKSFGVYQIYGDHPVYGLDVLLYIGVTKLSSNRNFRKRIKEHLTGRFWHHHGLSVRFGEIFHQNKQIDDDSEIKAIESILIAANIPALNRQNIDNASGHCSNLLIRNQLFRGSIVPECTGEFWC